MAVAVSPTPDAASLTAPERALAPDLRRAVRARHARLPPPPGRHGAEPRPGGKPPRVPDARAEPGTGRVRLLARAGGRQHGDHHRLRVARRRRRAGPASPRLSDRRVEAGVVAPRASPLRAMDARLPAAHDRAGRPADLGHPAAGTRTRPARRQSQDEEELLRLVVRLP